MRAGGARGEPMGLKRGAMGADMRAWQPSTRIAATRRDPPPALAALKEPSAHRPHSTALDHHLLARNHLSEGALELGLISAEPPSKRAKAKGHAMRGTDAQTGQHRVGQQREHGACLTAIRQSEVRPLSPPPTFPHSRSFRTELPMPLSCTEVCICILLLSTPSLFLSASLPTCCSLLA